MKAIDILINEHRVIEQVLNCLERMVEQCRTTGRLEIEPARDALAFFREFAESAHLAREKAILFPLVAGTTCPQGCQSDQLMAREEAHGHRHLEAMTAAVASAAAGDKKALKQFVEHGELYISLLMKYVANEEDWLFHQVDHLLTEDAARGLAEQLQTTESAQAVCCAAQPYVALANRLADHFGVPRATLIDN